jgi:hypothetical protein
MAFNHDKKYEHFTEKEFRPKAGGELGSNRGETSKDEPKIDWKQMKGLQKPWEDCEKPMDTYVRGEKEEKE